MAWEHYAALESPRTAAIDELRSAYRRIAIASHPDHHPNDPVAADRFRRAADAWGVLGDAAKRAAYDLSESLRSAIPPAPAPREASPSNVDARPPRHVNLRPGGPLPGFARGGFAVVYCQSGGHTQVSETFSTVDEANDEARRLRRMGLRTLRLVRS